MLFGKKKTFVMDYDTLADPRIAEFVGYGLITGRFLLPEPPAGSAPGNDHQLRRAKETIARLKKLDGVTVKLDAKLRDREALLAALRKNKATLITSSTELKGAAGSQPAISLTQLYTLFKPVYMPGTALKVRIAKKGKEKNEGIGYLEGGIKVVVENAAGAIGSELEVVISGGIDTDVGQVVFAKPRFIEVK